MPVESWTRPEETPALAATATAMIDAALVGSGMTRDAYWAAVCKGYNTPYNDPQPKPPATPAVPVLLAIDLAEAQLPVAVMAAATAAAEIHAA